MGHAETVEFDEELPVADWPMQLTRRSPTDTGAQTGGPKWHSRQGPVLGVALVALALVVSSSLLVGDPAEDAEADAAETLFTADGAGRVATEFPAPIAAIALSFASSPKAPFPPRAFVRPASDLTDGQEFELEIDGLEPRSGYLITQCIHGLTSADSACSSPLDRLARLASDGGTITLTLLTQRFHFINGEWFDCASLPTGSCVVHILSTNDQRSPGAVALHFDPTSDGPNRRFAVASPVELADNFPAVTFWAEAPILQQGYPGIALCREGITDACTNLTRDNEVIETNTTKVDLELPRRFTTWQGETHDCVLVAPCELRFWGQDNVLNEYSTPVLFDPDSFLRNVSVAETSTAGPYLDGDVITVRVNGPTRYNAIQCVVDQSRSCGETIHRLVVADGSTSGALTLALSRTIITPRGAHDCAVDGPCELRFINTGRYVAPVPLTFSGEDNAEVPPVIVRPTSGLGHGSLLELRTVGGAARQIVTSLCTDAGACLWLADSRVTVENAVARLRVPRYFNDVYDHDPERDRFDCAVDACSLRTSFGGHIVDTPLLFTGPDPFDEDPQLRLGDARGVTERDLIPLRLSGFFVVDPDAVNALRFFWCRGPDDAFSACVRASVTNALVDGAGSAQTTVRIPTRAATVRRPSDGPVCQDDCWLVASFEREFQRAATQAFIDAAK